MASEVEICNQALSHIGSGKPIAILTERSEEAEVCRTFYAGTRDIVLRDFPWPFASRIVALGLVATDPNDDWGYSYRYPTDCLHDIKIMGAGRNIGAGDRIEYEIGSDSTGGLVYADQADAELKYTARITDPNRFTPDFAEALGYLMAVKIGPRLTGGDPRGLVKEAERRYMWCISKAKASAANEGQVGLPAESSFIEGR